MQEQTKNQKEIEQTEAQISELQGKLNQLYAEAIEIDDQTIEDIVKNF